MFSILTYVGTRQQTSWSTSTLPFPFLSFGRFEVRHPSLENTYSTVPCLSYGFVLGLCSCPASAVRVWHLPHHHPSHFVCAALKRQDHLNIIIRKEQYGIDCTVPFYYSKFEMCISLELKIIHLSKLPYLGR